MREPIDIVVVDDDELTAELVVRALRGHDLPHRVLAAADGFEALNMLLGGGSDPARRPYLVLLDLNMPGMNGFEFLEAVRARPAIRDSVIFVLTTSSSDSDRARAYAEQIAGFMTKSAVGPQFAQLARLLSDYAQSVRLLG